MQKNVSRLMVLILAFTLLAGGVFSAIAENADRIQAAIDAANTLSTFAYILPDGSLVANPSAEEFTDTYTSIGKIRKIEHTSHSDNPAVLTESGDLYVGNKLVAQNIQEVLYPEMKMSGYGVYFAEDNTVAEFDFDSDEVTVWPRLHDYQKFTRYDTETFEPIYFDGKVTFATCDDFYFWVLDEEGRPYCYGEVSGNLYKADIEDIYTFDYDKFPELPFWSLELHNWNDLAVFAFAADEDLARNKEFFTYAGIKKDGTVVACGEHAEEILSWGPLVYLDGKDGNILGVTADGKVKLAGPDALAPVLDELNTWSNIVSAKLISGNSTSYNIGVLAATDDGSFESRYFEVWGSNNEYSNVYGVSLSPEEGYTGSGYSVYNIAQ